MACNKAISACFMLAWFTSPVGSAAYVFTNDKISTCAKETRANNTPWLTANNASYICTDEQFDKYYDPATSIGFFLLNDDATMPAQAACPKGGDVMKCFVFASWGQVAGGPDAFGDTCSTQMLTGSKSCCAKACTSSGDLQMSTKSSTNCKNNKWMTSKTASCGKGGDGYCDCCPNCFDCVHPANPPAPSPSTVQKSFVENRFCDCRKGLDVAPDYAPCWNSGLDCFGDDGTVQYMPDDIAASCIGKESCYIFAQESSSSIDEKFPPSSDGKGYWQKCTSSATSSCTKSSTQTTGLPDKSKAKGIVLCGPQSDVVV